MKTPPFLKGRLGGIFMRRYYGAYLKQNARELRKNMTYAERKLWGKLRRRQLNSLQFVRQKPLGPYIVDFYCPVVRLVITGKMPDISDAPSAIEIDGGQHYFDEGIAKDAQRDRYLIEKLKLNVLRFTNTDILKNIDGVMFKIASEISQK
jgi:very-short-patch-repair endonuclease